METKQPLTLAAIREANVVRCARWHGPNDPWTVADWSNAMAGEAGEVCNAVKKLRRHEFKMKGNLDPKSEEELVNEIAKEIGDTFLYLDLLAAHLGLSLAECVVNTFNRVSIREGFPDRL